ncbi:hypothetical protein REPUB_Repub08aG0239500 [Reevesia pubescens]
MKEHKNPKVLSEGLLWMVSTVEDFGVSHLKLKDLFDFFKDTRLQSGAEATRNATIKVLVALHKFIGPDIKGLLTDVKPALLSALDAEYEKNPFEVFKCIPITRGAGIYQEHMNEALRCLNNGAWTYHFKEQQTPKGFRIAWAFVVSLMDALNLLIEWFNSLHTFPEGKVSQKDAPIRRLKWGTASLIVRAHVTPIVLPMVHCGFQEVMPEQFLLGRRPPFPLCNKNIKIIIGEPLEFDIPKMRELAISMSRDLSFTSRGWPIISPYGLDEAA